jgi:AcrR family transcriptional regulator
MPGPPPTAPPTRPLARAPGGDAVPAGEARGPRVTPAGARRRRAILAAALECFDRQGIRATTIEDIRVASGASVGSIYHHVGGRDAIVAALYLDAVTAYRSGIAAALVGGSHPRAALGEAVRFHVRWIVGHPALARLTLHWDESELGEEGRRALRRAAARFDGDLAAWHRSGVEDGTLADLPDDVAAACLLGPLLEAARRLVHRRRLPDDADATVTADLLADRIWQSLRR